MGNTKNKKLKGDRFWLEEKAIGVGIWQGEFQGNTRLGLLWYDIDGEWIPNKDEMMAQERSWAEQELRQR